MPEVSASDLGIYLGQVATLVGIWATYRSNRRLLMLQKSREAAQARLTSQLAELYGPLDLLLSLAVDAYKQFMTYGGEGDREAANGVMEKVLIPTNDKITLLVMAKAHLIDATDDLATYKAFLLHASLLQVRKESGTASEASRFPGFPAEFPRNVRRIYEMKRREYVLHVEDHP